MNPVIRALLAVLALTQTAPVLSQGHAHVHGQAQVEVVLDGQALQISLQSPLDSIVGFEHRPRTAAQRQAADNALRTLAAPAAPFVLPAAAACVLQAQTVDAPVLQADAGGRDGQGGDHADLDASWSYRCSAPERLDRLSLRLFDHFPAMARLELHHAGPWGQGRQVLRRGAAAEVRLRR